MTVHSSGVNLVWNLGVVDAGQKNFDFSRQISEKFQFFQAISQKISIFPTKFSKKFNFSRQIFKNFWSFMGNFLKISFSNCSFTATSGQIILFLFKSHHFRTYFLYMIRYISRPVHDPPCNPYLTPAQNLWVTTPNPQDWHPWYTVYSHVHIQSPIRKCIDTVLN